MKKLYTSPTVTVEELAKVDVLSTSTEQQNSNNFGGAKRDNINQMAKTIGDMSGLL
ncbi:MAG: hypothetical protein IIU39_01385 [Ruminococcus sp.]|nr:hypothetical protein [Ruminococcus sp.]